MPRRFFPVRPFFVFVALSLLAACASQLPEQLPEVPPFQTADQSRYSIKSFFEAEREAPDEGYKKVFFAIESEYPVRIIATGKNYDVPESHGTLSRQGSNEYSEGVGVFDGRRGYSYVPILNGQSEFFKAMVWSGQLNDWQGYLYGYTASDVTLNLKESDADVYLIYQSNLANGEKDDQASMEAVSRDEFVSHLQRVGDTEYFVVPEKDYEYYAIGDMSLIWNRCALWLDGNPPFDLGSWGEGEPVTGSAQDCEKFYLELPVELAGRPRFKKYEKEYPEKVQPVIAGVEEKRRLAIAQSIKDQEEREQLALHEVPNKSYANFYREIVRPLTFEHHLHSGRSCSASDDWYDDDEPSELYRKANDHRRDAKCVQDKVNSWDFEKYGSAHAALVSENERLYADTYKQEKYKIPTVEEQFSEANRLYGRHISRAERAIDDARQLAQELAEKEEARQRKKARNAAIWNSLVQMQAESERQLQQTYDNTDRMISQNTARRTDNYNTYREFSKPVYAPKQPAQIERSQSSQAALPAYQGFDERNSAKPVHLPCVRMPPADQLNDIDYAVGWNTCHSQGSSGLQGNASTGSLGGGSGSGSAGAQDASGGPGKSGAGDVARSDRAGASGDSGVDAEASGANQSAGATGYAGVSGSVSQGGSSSPEKKG